MTESPAAEPLRVGGTSMPFKAAHGIVKSTGLAFEHAYTLARLVLEEGGGPVSCRGRSSFIKKPAETALMRLGLIEVDASSEFTQRYYIELNADGRISERLVRLVAKAMIFSFLLRPGTAALQKGQSSEMRQVRAGSGN